MRVGEIMLKSVRNSAIILIVLASTLGLVACSGNVGVGVSVGVPVGSHGYMRVGTSRWY